MISKKQIQKLQQKYDKALSLLVEYNIPCEIDDFMNKNSDYCKLNCGVDNKVFKKCWDKFIEQKIEEEGELKNESKIRQLGKNCNP